MRLNAYDTNDCSKHTNDLKNSDSNNMSLSDNTEYL